MPESASETSGRNTEPSAVRGPQRGSPAGVEDAPDARVYLGKTQATRMIPKLPPASGATALGSELTCPFLDLRRFTGDFALR